MTWFPLQLGQSVARTALSFARANRSDKEEAEQMT